MFRHGVAAPDASEECEEQFFATMFHRSRKIFNRIPGVTTPLVPESWKYNAEETDEQRHTRRNNIVSSLIAMLQGVEVFCSLAIMYLYKDDFGLPPASMGLLMACIRLPWTLKPIWALMSDSLPILGYRRKSYVILGALLCCVSTIGMSTVGYLNVYAATFLLLLYFLGSAICNVIGEALVVEAGRNADEGAAETVSTFFATRKVSFAVMAWLSGWLLDYVAKQQVFLISTVLPLVVFIAAFFLHEVPCGTIQSLAVQVARLQEVIAKPSLTNSTLFIFCTMMTPSAGAAMFYFMTNELHFGPELLGRMALCQSVASLSGILCYRIFFSKTSIRKLLLFSTLIICPFCLLPVIVVQRWNIALGIPDSYFVVTDNVLMEFLGEFQAMPILVLAARLCPPGLESTIYSFLLSGYNLGLAVSSVLSAGLTATLGVTANSFARLSILIVVCAFTSFLPLALIGLVPNEKDLERDLGKEEESDKVQPVPCKYTKSGSSTPAPQEISRSVTISTVGDDDNTRSPSGSSDDLVLRHASTSRVNMESISDPNLVADTGGDV